MRDDEPGDRARAEAEERAWREIVDGYGDAPDVAELAELTSPLEQPVYDPEDEDAFRTDGDDERFTPPPLPPPPIITPERRVAWVGLVASPALLVTLNLLGYSLPNILTAGLVIALIASFAYLVATMAPRDPDDDGARL